MQFEFQMEGKKKKNQNWKKVSYALRIQLARSFANFLATVIALVNLQNNHVEASLLVATRDPERKHEWVARAFRALQLPVQHSSFLPSSPARWKVTERVDGGDNALCYVVDARLSKNVFA